MPTSIWMRSRGCIIMKFFFLLSSPNLVPVMFGLVRKFFLRFSSPTFQVNQDYPIILYFFVTFFRCIMVVILCCNVNQSCLQKKMSFNCHITQSTQKYYYNLLEKIIHIKYCSWAKYCMHVSHIIHQHVSK